MKECERPRRGEEDPASDRDGPMGELEGSTTNWVGEARRAELDNPEDKCILECLGNAGCPQPQSMQCAAPLPVTQGLDGAAAS